MKKLYRHLRAESARLIRDRRGNFAAVSVVMAIPLLAGVAVAVDMGRTINVRSQIQNAADAAALAAAAMPHDTSEDVLQRLVDSFFASNGANAELSRRTEVRLTERQVYVEVQATAHLAPTFRLPGFSEGNSVNVLAKAGKVGLGSEVSIVIDLTGSMGFGMSWPHVADAVGDLLDRLRAAGPSARFRVSLVPFNDRVNLGPIALDWLEDEVLIGNPCPPGRTPRIPPGHVNDDDDDGDDDDDNDGLPDHVICMPGGAPAHGLLAASAYPLLQPWRGCLEPREETVAGNPHALTDRPPDEEQFLPTIPGLQGPLIAATGSQCPPPVITPTTNIAAIESAVSGFSPAPGTGRFDDALAWGWRMVSENWRGEYGEAAWPARAGETNKQVFLFTDGHSTANEHEMGSTRSNLGWNNGSTQMWEMIEAQCARMKDAGVSIGVFHVLGNAAAAPYLERCASTGQYFGINNRDDFLAAVDRAVLTTSGQPRLIH
ncbi:MAG: pilus assembly protein TadG-related protein [Rhizobiaceae bacterium]|nr:pilus assembly protein TadG-related protein [Rhizobiaceae bacterium]